MANSRKRRPANRATGRGIGETAIFSPAQRAGLLFSTSALALTGLLMAEPAGAACSDHAPDSGEKVVCNALPPNPDPRGRVIPDADDVTVNIEELASITNPDGSVFERPSGSEITVGGEKCQFPISRDGIAL